MNSLRKEISFVPLVSITITADFFFIFAYKMKENIKKFGNFRYNQASSIFSRIVKTNPFEENDIRFQKIDENCIAPA